MKLAEDKILHLKLSVPLTLFLSITAYIAVTFGMGFAVAFSSVGVGLGLEAYQHYRKEGTASGWDAVASSAVGVLVGLGYELWKFLL